MSEQWFISVGNSVMYGYEGVKFKGQSVYRKNQKDCTAIAFVYDKTHTPLIATAPDLLSACDVAYGLITKRDSHEPVDIEEVVGMLKGAMLKAGHDYSTPRG